MKTLKEALFSKRNLKPQNPFGLTEEDIKGDLSERAIPMGIIVRMLEEQKRQGNRVDVKVFQKEHYSGLTEGGFNWCDTEAGQDFWLGVLNERNYDLFFERYPKYEIYNL